MPGIKPAALKEYLQAKDDPNLPAADELISINAAAKEFSMPCSTISEWVKQGHIRAVGPAVKGLRRMIYKRDVAILARLYPYGKWQIAWIMEAVN